MLFLPYCTLFNQYLTKTIMYEKTKISFSCLFYYCTLLGHGAARQTVCFVTNIITWSCRLETGYAGKGVSTIMSTSDFLGLLLKSKGQILVENIDYLDAVLSFQIQEPILSYILKATKGILVSVFSLCIIWVQWGWKRLPYFSPKFLLLETKISISQSGKEEQITVGNSLLKWMGFPVWGKYKWHKGQVKHMASLWEGTESRCFKSVRCPTPLTFHTSSTSQQTF